MLAKLCVGLLATAAIGYGGAALYLGDCPFRACCHSSCGGTQPQADCPVHTYTPPCCTAQTETNCCETPDAACAAVSVCGSAFASEGGSCPNCPVAAATPHD